MKASLFLNELKNIGIDVMAGVPDSTLKQLCDAINLDNGKLFKHYVTANEGAAVGLATGSYLATGKPACIYMQNSGEGNIINPLASIANDEVYGIPMLFLIGWRGEPGVKDEPQHVYQGKVTCKLLEVMNVPYAVIDENTTIDDIKVYLNSAAKSFEKHMQYAIIIKKGTFEAQASYKWDNGYTLVREQALKTILEVVYKDTYFVSTTGKISRELYEQSDRIYGGHDRIFMTVGGMGHASMIAYGVAQADESKKIVCVDGDGAVMMHMGALAFIANKQPKNMLHIVINNSAHESVGSMPTGYTGHTYADIAKACGYKNVYTVSTEEDLRDVLGKVKDNDELTMIEVLVSLESRKDLGRPKESASQNRENFMKSYSN
jgi:phosphonopyruvate decarboxylase